MQFAVHDGVVGQRLYHQNLAEGSAPADEPGDDDDDDDDDVEERRVVVVLATIPVGRRQDLTVAGFLCPESGGSPRGT